MSRKGSPTAVAIWLLLSSTLAYAGIEECGKIIRCPSTPESQAFTMVSRWSVRDCGHGIDVLRSICADICICDMSELDLLKICPKMHKPEHYDDLCNPNIS